MYAARCRCSVSVTTAIDGPQALRRSWFRPIPVSDPPPCHSRTESYHSDAVESNCVYCVLNSQAWNSKVLSAKFSPTRDILRPELLDNLPTLACDFNTMLLLRIHRSNCKHYTASNCPRHAPDTLDTPPTTHETPPTRPRPRTRHIDSTTDKVKTELCERHHRGSFIW